METKTETQKNTLGFYHVSDAKRARGWNNTAKSLIELLVKEFRLKADARFAVADRLASQKRFDEASCEVERARTYEEVEDILRRVLDV